MPRLKVTLLDAKTGAALADTADVELRLQRAGSAERVEINDLNAADNVIEVELPRGVYTLHLETDEKILSLHRDKAQDFDIVILEDEDSAEAREFHVWDINPDRSVALPVTNESGGVQAQVFCSYCDNRYQTPGTIYYMNYTWWWNCRYNPPCSPG